MDQVGENDAYYNLCFTDIDLCCGGDAIYTD